MKKHVIFKKRIELDWKILKMTYKQVFFFNCWQMILNNKLFSLFSFRNLDIFCCFSLGDVRLGWYCWVTEERDQQYLLKDGEIPVTSYETKLVSLTSDSASVTTGRILGFMTRFVMERDKLVQIHCINYRVKS